MEIRELKSDKLSKLNGAYSQAIELVHPEKLVFVSGFTSRDKDGNVVGVGDIRAQTDQVLSNIQAILAEAGATMKDVVKYTIYITDMKLFGEIGDIRRQYFSEPYPACATVEVSRMVNSDHLIEIDAIAAVRA
mgnify:CR=1 FL=1|jgi:Putative translation initiation inhibitor, yjgF family